MNRFLSVLLAALFATALPPVITMRADSDQLTTAQVAAIVLTEIEKRIIRKHYEQQYEAWVAVEPAGNGKAKGKHKNKGLPPGIAKKGTLPPGIYKQLVRNGSLPPGLEMQAMPPTVIVQLRPRPSGYEFAVVDDKVLLIQSATNLILDVLTVVAADAS